MRSSSFTYRFAFLTYMGYQWTEASNDTCSDHKGTISLPVKPSFLAIHDFGDAAGVSLYVTSFYNVARNSGIPFAKDVVLRIPNIDQALENNNLDSVIIEELTNLNENIFNSHRETFWPNDAIRVPDGVFPFNAILIPQGFLTNTKPGRLTAINMDTPNHEEYIIDQSTFFRPRYYHDAVFYDMDGDGLLDIVTVRSGFYPAMFRFIPVGELV